MNSLDFIIIGILGYNIFVGTKLGAIRMISGLVGVLVATIYSKKLFNSFFALAADHITLFASYPFLFFGACFLGILSGFQVVAGLLHHIFKWTGVGLFNHIFGLFLGLVRGSILSLIIIIPLVLTQSSLVEKSLVLYDTKPFVDLIIVNLSDSNYFSDLFKLIQLPQTPFEIDASLLKDIDISDMELEL